MDRITDLLKESYSTPRPFPIDEARWQLLDIELRKNRRRKALLWWLGGSASLLLVAFISFWIVQPTPMLAAFPIDAISPTAFLTVEKKSAQLSSKINLNKTPQGAIEQTLSSTAEEEQLRTITNTSSPSEISAKHKITSGNTTPANFQEKPQALAYQELTLPESLLPGKGREEERRIQQPPSSTSLNPTSDTRTSNARPKPVQEAEFIAKDGESTPPSKTINSQLTELAKAPNEVVESPSWAGARAGRHPIDTTKKIGLPGQVSGKNPIGIIGPYMEPVEEKRFSWRLFGGGVLMRQTLFMFALLDEPYIPAPITLPINFDPPKIEINGQDYYSLSIAYKRQYISTWQFGLSGIYQLRHPRWQLLGGLEYIFYKTENTDLRDVFRINLPHSLLSSKEQVHDIQLEAGVQFQALRRKRFESALQLSLLYRTTLAVQQEFSLLDGQNNETSVDDGHIFTFRTFDKFRLRAAMQHSFALTNSWQVSLRTGLSTELFSPSSNWLYFSNLGIGKTF